MAKISVLRGSVVYADTDAIVNAANAQLAGGSGVCGAIFEEAGWNDMQQACDRIGGCPTGEAVSTPGFKLKAKYVIHAAPFTQADRAMPSSCAAHTAAAWRRPKSSGCTASGSAPLAQASTDTR